MASIIASVVVHREFCHGQHPRIFVTNREFCHGQHPRICCGKQRVLSWLASSHLCDKQRVRIPIRSNQRLTNWYLLSFHQSRTACYRFFRSYHLLLRLRQPIVFIGNARTFFGTIFEHQSNLKSGYFGVGIIWRFCVKMGWLNFGMLKLGLCIEGVFYFSVLHQRCVLFWLIQM